MDSSEFNRIVEIIRIVQPDKEISSVHPELEYLDIRGKLGRESLAPIREEGFVVSAVCSEITELDGNETRIWFERID